MSPSSAEQNELKDALRAAGLRATTARVAVLRLLRATTGPLSHADVADRLGDGAWDRATLYRNLIDLVDAGLLRRFDHGDHVWRFELARPAHPDGDPHAHFVCTDCGTIECLPELDVGVKGRAPRAVKKRKVEIEVRGVCDRCD
ncbi:MAG: transcriptional repressor [Kofleriaceae bacterium]|nr:transcriptional repressor [Kofleriaceae bacterium]